mgnify:CR=1 FL=1
MVEKKYPKRYTAGLSKEDIKKEKVLKDKIRREYGLPVGIFLTYTKHFFSLCTATIKEDSCKKNYISRASFNWRVRLLMCAARPRHNTDCGSSASLNALSTSASLPISFNNTLFHAEKHTLRK